MEGVGFSQKWGIVPEDVHERRRSVWVVMLGQFVVLVLLLCIVRPSFVLDADSSLKLPQVSGLRVVLVSIVVVLITYFYPALVASVS